MVLFNGLKNNKKQRKHKFIKGELKIMALPFATEGQLKILEQRIAALEKRLAQVEAQASQQKIKFGENTDGTISLNVED